jgi:hypothetical protein
VKPTSIKLDSLIARPRPFLFLFGWPDAIGVNADSIAAVFLSGELSREGCDGVIVRPDGRFLEFTTLGKAWRLTAGDFSGDQSRNDSVIVRLDEVGRPILPRNGILRILPGNNGAECNRHEALGVALHFIELGQLPPRLIWWRKD